MTAAVGRTSAPARRGPGLVGQLRASAVAFSAMAWPAPALVATSLLPAMVGISADRVLVALTISGLVVLTYTASVNAMARRVQRPGGLYAYATAGLGRRAGLGTAFVAIFTYSLLLFATWAAFGFHARRLFRGLGFSLPWYSFAFTGVVVAGVVAYQRVKTSARLIAVVVGIELSIVLVVGLVVLVDPAHQAIPFPSIMDPIGGASDFGLAVVLGCVCFAGAGSTQSYYEEMRRPSRTIPRAQYASIAALGLIYLLTTASLLIGREPSHDPDQSAVTSVPMSALVMIASFAMALALHNLVARYLYSLGRDGVFSTKLGAAHPELGSPYRASFYLTVLELSAVLVIGIMTDLKADGAAAHLIFLGASGLSAIGIVALFTLVSLATLTYIVRNRRAARLEGRWRAVVPPVIALAGTASILALSWCHAQDLIGAGGVVSAMIPIIVPLVFAAGYAYASRLAKRRPEVFARIGRR